MFPCPGDATRNLHHIYPDLPTASEGRYDQDGKKPQSRGVRQRPCIMRLCGVVALQTEPVALGPCRFNPAWDVDSHVASQSGRRVYPSIVREWLSWWLGLDLWRRFVVERDEMGGCVQKRVRWIVVQCSAMYWTCGVGGQARTMGL